jgi:hypothetical protein
LTFEAGGRLSAYIDRPGGPLMTGWWRCPGCDSVVPFSYQIEECFSDDGQARFDSGEPIVPREPGALTASWLKVIRCPDPRCDRAWALTLYPASKALFEDELIQGV